MKDNLALQNIGRRLTSESPSFFKKVFRVMGAIGVISGAALASFATAGVALPAVLTTIFTYGTAIGLTGAAISKLTVADNSEVEKK